LGIRSYILSGRTTPTEGWQDTCPDAAKYKACTAVECGLFFALLRHQLSLSVSQLADEAILLIVQ
jgi:hypothetical protein